MKNEESEAVSPAHEKLIQSLMAEFGYDRDRAEADAEAMEEQQKSGKPPKSILD